MHNKCNAFESSPSPKSMEKLSSTKPSPVPKRLGTAGILLKLQMPILSDSTAVTPPGNYILKIPAHVQKGIYARVLISAATFCH